MIPKIFTARSRIGVTGVTRVTLVESHAGQGLERHTEDSDSHTVTHTRVTVARTTCDGVTPHEKRCDAQTPASQGFAGSVTPATRVTPKKQQGRKISGAAPPGGLGWPVADGCYCPWGPYPGEDGFRHLREEFAATITTLAALEAWPPDLLDSIMIRAMREPLADLLPNVNHFRERLAVARDEAAARDAASARTWRYDPAKR